MLVLVLGMTSAAPAHAAGPGWKLLGVTKPTNLPPRQSEVQRLTVEAQAGTFTLSRVTGAAQGTLSFGGGFASPYIAGATQITAFATAGAFAVGQEFVTGSGIAPGTTVTSVSGSIVGLSQPTQGAGSGAVSAASKTVTGLTGVSGEFRVGDAISGAGIPAATTVAAVSGDTLTLSAFPTQGGAKALQATETTGPVDFDADPQDLQAALEALPAHPAGSVTVTGGPGGDQDHPYFIEFGGPLADRDITQFTATGSFPDPGERAMVATTVPGGLGQGVLEIFLNNVGGAASDGTETLTVGPLPAGITLAGPPTAPGGGAATTAGWFCPGVVAGAAEVTCSRIAALDPLIEAKALIIPVTVDSGAPASSSIPMQMQGGGATRVEQAPIEVTVSREPAEPGVQAQWAGSFDDEGNPSVQAGGHPNAAASSFVLTTNRRLKGDVLPAGDPHDVIVDLPPGFVGNPMVTPRCPTRMPFLTEFDCKQDSIVGEIFVNGPNLPVSPLTSSVPERGLAAQFNFIYLSFARISVAASLRSDEDYGVSVLSPNVAQDGTPVFRVTTILHGNPVGAAGKAFITNPSDCVGNAERPPMLRMFVDAWHQRGVFHESETPVSAVVGCEDLEFTPEFAFQPSAASAATGTATTAHVQVDQSRLLDPGELAPPHLKDSVVTLPEGLTLNPSAADGLEGCSTGQVGYKGDGFSMPNPMRFDEEPVECPDASKIGTAEIETPLLDKPLNGDVFLAAQGDNPFGSLLALYIVVDDEQTGIVVKLPGEVTPDKQTGQLKAEFKNNPQVPFEDLTLEFRGGGPRSTLATPAVCGTYTTNGSWTPWSAPASGPAAQTEDSFTISSGPNGTGCANSDAQRPFDLGLQAGTAGRAGRAFTPFTLRLTRPDGNQELDKVSVSVPKGMLASLRDIPYCSESAIAQANGRTAQGTGKLEQAMPSCPTASQIGTTSVGAGVGPAPFYAGGKVYLAGAYKGAPLSMVVVVPAVAGPFDLGVQVVRTALHVDRQTAQVTAVSDTIPKILEGVPLQIQDVRVHLDRPGFTLNPSDCSQKQVGAEIASAQGKVAGLSNPFQASGCAALAFKPKLALRLTGRRQVRTGKHPGVRAKVTQQGTSEAGIEKTVVRLPKSLALDPNNAQALCEFADGTKPDLENHCPKGSIVGRARAVSPLLDDPLVGNVYFVKNIRKDAVTGNEIRTLPMIVVALRGQIAINLTGESSTTRGGKLVNTFANVPDAPISQFNLNIRGGKNGILAVTRTRRAKINLCAGRHIAEVDNDGQNGRRHDYDVRMKTPCSKRQTRKAKRAAKKAARKARNARS